jgi:peroxiredoxin
MDIFQQACSEPMETDMPKIEPSQSTPAELDAEQIVAMTLEAATLANHALRAGSMAPAFRLRDYGGQQVSLQELCSTGPAIVHFYRGSWCTYCQNSLTDLTMSHDNIRSAGARIVAIAPPPSPRFLAAAQVEAARLPFSTLIDEGMNVAVAYGVAYSLPAELRPIYLERGYAPPRNSRAGEWLVPIPAMYLIGTDGTIVLGAVDVDYRNPLHSGQLVTAVKGMRRANARPSGTFKVSTRSGH